MVPTLVLASASPRRRELLRRLWADFAVSPAGVDESHPSPVVADAVRALALRKARAVASGRGAGLVLGADTVVVLDGEPLGKPRDAAEARRMLRRLRGREHEVLTGVALVDAGTGRSGSDLARTRVVMARYPDEVIEAYVASGGPLDKAGAYGIQDLEGALVAGWIGSYSNVVGLPLAQTRRLLAGVGLLPGLEPAGEDELVRRRDLQRGR